MVDILNPNLISKSGPYLASLDPYKMINSDSLAKVGQFFCLANSSQVESACWDRLRDVEFSKSYKFDFEFRAIFGLSGYFSNYKFDL